MEQTPGPGLPLSGAAPGTCKALASTRMRRLRRLRRDVGWRSLTVLLPSGAVAWCGPTPTCVQVAQGAMSGVALHMAVMDAWAAMVEGSLVHKIERGQRGAGRTRQQPWTMLAFPHADGRGIEAVAATLQLCEGNNCDPATCMHNYTAHSS